MSAVEIITSDQRLLVRHPSHFKFSSADDVTKGTRVTPFSTCWNQEGDFGPTINGKKIAFVLMASVIAVVVFFPTGIFSCYYAVKARKALYTCQSISLVRSYVTKAQRLAVCSVIVAAIIWTVTISLWTRYNLCG